MRQTSSLTRTNSLAACHPLFRPTGILDRHQVCSCRQPFKTSLMVLGPSAIERGQGLCIGWVGTLLYCDAAKADCVKTTSTITSRCLFYSWKDCKSCSQSHTMVCSYLCHGMDSVLGQSLHFLLRNDTNELLARLNEPKQGLNREWYILTWYCQESSITQ